MGCSLSVEDDQRQGPGEVKGKSQEPESISKAKAKKEGPGSQKPKAAGGKAREPNGSANASDKARGSIGNNNGAPGGSGQSRQGGQGSSRATSKERAPGGSANGFGASGDLGGLTEASATSETPEAVLDAVVGIETLRSFSYKELHKATKGFKKKLGEGGFGSVFMGRVTPLEGAASSDDGQVVTVAVKVLDPSSKQGSTEWQSEVQHLAALKHKNIVRLLGYCQEGDEWLLVYEFVPRGSFDYHLFNVTKAPVSFVDRLNVMLQAARGLEFLHQNNVIYRDFKTSNILVDQHFNAKLADFGLAREGPDPGHSYVSTGIKGTLAYMAPEYIATGHLNKACDVYSFGVVLLEILSGRQASARADILEGTAKRLVEQARQVCRDKSKQHELIDTRLKDKDNNPQGMPSKTYGKLLQAASMCIDSEASLRPGMAMMVEVLGIAHQQCIQMVSKQGT